MHTGKLWGKFVRLSLFEEERGDSAPTYGFKQACGRREGPRGEEYSLHAEEQIRGPNNSKPR